MTRCVPVAPGAPLTPRWSRQRERVGGEFALRLSAIVGLLMRCMRVSQFRAASVRLAIAAAAVACLGASTRSQSETLPGHWDGTLLREGAQLAVSFDFFTGAKGIEGTFSAASQRALGIPLDTVTINGTLVRFVLDGTLVFNGTLSAAALRGDFQDRDAPGTFALRRSIPAPLPYRSTEITFRNGDVALAGTLFIPTGARRHPAAVFNHGSGPEARFASRFWADYLARRGIATLIYDKRGVGKSTGDWTQSNFDDLADDALAAVHALQRQPGVNSRQVGIYGHSQGGTIAPLIASRSKDVAFVIAAAAIGMPVYQQDLFRVRNELRASGLAESDVTEAMRVYSAWLDVARTGVGRDRLGNVVDSARGRPWFSEIEPPPDDHWLWKWYPAIGNYNGVVFWERVTVPVLLVYGEQDDNTPVRESIAAIEAALVKAGNQHFTPIILPKAAHNLTVRPEPGQPFEWWRVAPGYADVLVDWIRGRTSGLE